MKHSESPENVPSLPRVAMIGVGSMGGAILTGLLAPGGPVPLPISVTTKSQASAERFAGAADVVALSSEADPEANRKTVAGAGIVMLGVKPWALVETAEGIADALDPAAIVVSVAAGVPAAKIEAVLPTSVQVVRAMPNTPSHVGRGVTGVAGGASASPEAVELVRGLFEAIGAAVTVREDQINAVAAVSGSGPAYLFLYAEEMVAAAERLGFEPDVARTLALDTITGAAELMRQSEDDPAQLRRNVTSPKGTTEQAITVLQEANLGELFDRALAANVRRSEELEGN